MAYISFQPKDYFNTLLYTGTGSTNAVTGVGFAPDMIWGKNRNQTYNHQINDTVRSVNKQLAPNNTNAEETNTGELTAFGSDGFTLGTGGTLNGSGDNIVAWNWRAGGSGSSNSDGSISSTVSANTTSGFSIVKYTGTGANATVGTGLGVAPKIVLVKDLSASASWRMYTEMTGNQSQLALDQTSAADSGNTTMWNSTSPTTTTFSIGTHPNVNTSSNNYIAYCFAEKKGFSKFGSYVGNGSADGSFIYTGMKTAFVIFKQTNTTGNWAILDSTRSYHNVANHTLATNLSSAESAFGGGESVDGASNKVDVVSNGIKIREASAYNNTSGGTYIYIAFAESPIVSSNGVPAVAR